MASNIDIFDYNYIVINLNNILASQIGNVLVIIYGIKLGVRYELRIKSFGNGFILILFELFNRNKLINKYINNININDSAEYSIQITYNRNKQLVLLLLDKTISLYISDIKITNNFSDDSFLEQHNLKDKKELALIFKSYDEHNSSTKN